MKITATLGNREGQHEVVVATNGHERVLAIPPNPAGGGSAVNGGELLFAALATCYCNDLYREAAKRGIAMREVRVEVEGEFGAPGEPARNVVYRVTVDGDAPDEILDDLVRHTDTVAEVQNTLRNGVRVELQR